MRCKMVLNQINMTTSGNQVFFYPVTDGTEEDKAFWKSTPSGKIEIMVVKDEPIAGMKIGKKYYVTFSEVPEGQ